MQLPPNQPLSANITLGNAFAFRFPFFQTLNLDGTDGFRYDVQCDGELIDGGTVDRHLNDAHDGMYILALSGSQFNRQFPCLSAGLLDQGARQVSLEIYTRK